MGTPNLPVTVPPEESERNRLVFLAESTQKFSLASLAAIHACFIRMVKDQHGLESEKFRTPNGRNCMIALAVGDDDVGKLTDAVADLTEPPQEQPGQQQQKDEREFIGRTLKFAARHGVMYEVVWSALYHMKRNPGSTVHDVMAAALKDWSE